MYLLCTCLVSDETAKINKERNEHEGDILLNKLSKSTFFLKQFFLFSGGKMTCPTLFCLHLCSSIHVRPMPLVHSEVNQLAVVALYLQLWISGRQINLLAECLSDFCCSDIMLTKVEQIALIAARDTKFCWSKIYILLWSALLLSSVLLLFDLSLQFIVFILLFWMTIDFTFIIHILIY